jgi:hypothetical protein
MTAYVWTLALVTGNDAAELQILNAAYFTSTVVIRTVATQRDAMFWKFCGTKVQPLTS